MPRGSDGSYSLPPGTIVSSGDAILPSQHNPAMQDIAQALSNSLDRNGSGGMRAPLNMGNNPIQNVADGSSDTDVATVGQLAGIGVPAGTILDYAGGTVPVGYLLCFGQAISRASYPDLFAAIGTIYGNGDGFSTFNLPDTRGRVSAAPDNMGGTAAGRMTAFSAVSLGAAGGTDFHILTAGQMPPHSHGGTTENDGTHTHQYSGDYVRDSSEPQGGTLLMMADGSLGGIQSGSFQTATASGVHSHAFTTNSQGGGQPQQAISHILKAFGVAPQALAQHIAQDERAYVAPDVPQQPKEDPRVAQLQQQLADVQAQQNPLFSYRVRTTS